MSAFTPMRPTALMSPVLPIPTTIVEKINGTISILIRLMKARDRNRNVSYAAGWVSAGNTYPERTPNTSA
jgi:hypothetical protein